MSDVTVSFGDGIKGLRLVACPGATERLRVGVGAAGRVLGKPVLAEMRSPAADVSAMDGYAVRSCDLAPLPARLRVVGEARPGTAPGAPIEPGTCARIFTGGALPPGADRVVVQEVVERAGEEAVFKEQPGASRFVRAAGSDFEIGDVLLPARQLLTPRALVAAAAGDVAELHVFAQPRVVLIATGDELVEPGEARARPGSIPDSISAALAALVVSWGGQVGMQARLRDDLDNLRKLAAGLIEEECLIVVSGGASVGEHDHGKAMFGDALELVFSKVAIKPGKPVWLGRAGKAIVLGLPGNPTSAMVTARLFLAPLLAGLCGRDPMAALAWRQAPLGELIGPTGGRETFSRARIVEGAVYLLPNQDSGAQRTLVDADLLVRRPIGAPGFAAGELVDVLDF